MVAFSTDPSDVLESKGQVLEFYQTFSGANVAFKAFLKNYSETFNSAWTQSQTLGRPDPIQTFRGTSRSIQLGWVVPAFDLQDAEANLVKTSTLARMLYPEYSKIDNASTMSKGPLIKIKFANLIFDASRGPAGDVRTSGLLGVITSYGWNPIIDEGFFDPGKNLFPKAITLSINFNVLHQHTLGWEKAEAVQLSERRRNGKERKRDVNKVNERREANASNAAPEWGSDAALFPWSAGLQRANTIIGTNTVGDNPTIEQANDEVLGGND